MSRCGVKMSKACLSSVAGYLVEVGLVHCEHVPSRVSVRNLCGKKSSILQKD